MTSATSYLIVEATRRKWGPSNPDTGLKPIEGIRVVGSRANRPAKLELDQIAVKVTIEVPDSAFNPVTPLASIVIPEDLALRGPIHVTAEDAHEAGETDE